MNADEFDMNDAAREPNEFAKGDGASAKGDGARGPLASLSGSNLVLVVLFAAGIAGVYLLSLRGGPAKSSADQQAMELKVDTALSQLTTSRDASGKRDGKNQSVLDTSFYDMKQRQVSLDDLRGNPFTLSVRNGAGGDQEPSSEKPPEATSPSEDLANMRRAAETLRLQSVLRGQHGATAMISDNLLSEGQLIGGWRVAEIGARRVLLKWKNETHVLTMGD